MIRTLSKVVLCAFIVFVLPHPARAAFYNYQTYAGQGVQGSIGGGTLCFSNDATTVYANLIKGPGSFVDNLVIFVDSAPGGYTSTAPLSDNGSAREIAVSGGTGIRSVANFAPGFEADYAIVLGINSGSAVYKLVDDGTGPHLELVRSGLNFKYPDSPNHTSYSFWFDWANIGLPDRNTNFFKFETSYISGNGYRWLESFEGLTGKEGYYSITFTNYDTYGVQPVPENTTTALAAFGGLAVAVTFVARLRRRLRACFEMGFGGEMPPRANS